MASKKLKGRIRTQRKIIGVLRNQLKLEKETHREVINGYVENIICLEQRLSECQKALEYANKKKWYQFRRIE